MAAQCGKGFPFLIKTDHQQDQKIKIEMMTGGSLNLGRHRRRTQYQSSTSLHLLRPRLTKHNCSELRPRASLISNLGYGSTATTSSSSSSSSIYVDSSYSFSGNRIREEQEQKRGNKHDVVNDIPISSSLEEDDHQEKLDEWMEYSVPEIVKNIEEAPLFMHVYGGKKTAIPTSSSIRIEKEKAVAESWPSIIRRWEQGSPIPDGIILVEQLHHYDDDNINNSQEVLPRPSSSSSSSNNNNSSSSRTTTAWGVLVQGRGDSVCACYILKTCRVRSSLGFCTHFCLARAKCFGEIAELQLKNSWVHHHT